MSFFQTCLSFNEVMFFWFSLFDLNIYDEFFEVYISFKVAEFYDVIFYVKRQVGSGGMKFF